MNSKLRSGFALVLALGCACGVQAAEQATASYPTRPIRLIVPQAPGGSNDIWARYFGAKVAERIGQQIVIDNRGGASTIIGTEMVARSNPDGYTILMASAAFTMNPSDPEVPKLPYDPIKDFDWAGLLATGPVMVTVGPTVPVKTLQELVTLGKTRTNYLTIATAGGAMHFVSAMFRSHSGVDAVIATYKGGAPAQLAVMSGEAHVAVSTILTAGSLVRAGKLKALALAADKRSPLFPDLPTTVEAGLPGYQASLWWAWGLRAGTPRAILNRLNAEITAVQQLPETQKRFALEGMEGVVMTSPEMRAMIPKDIAKWAKVAQDAGMKKPGGRS